MSKILELKHYDKVNNKSYNGKLEIKNITNEEADFYIYGDIISSEWKWEESDVNVQDVLDFLKDLDNVSNINIHTNSGGGNVFAGMAIYNVLKQHKATKTVYVDGLAGSIASVIAMVGDRIVIPANSYIMIHHALAPIIGNAIEMRKMADTLDVIDEGILEVYKSKLKDGVDIETIKQLIDDGTWLTGKQASEYFDIEVGEELQAVAYFGNIDVYANVPDELVAKVEDQEKEHDIPDVPKVNDNIENLKAKLKLECLI